MLAMTERMDLERALAKLTADERALVIELVAEGRPDAEEVTVWAEGLPTPNAPNLLDAVTEAAANELMPCIPGFEGGLLDLVLAARDRIKALESSTAARE